MSFLWPAMLLFLAALPLFVALYRRRLEQRRRLAARYGSLGRVQEATGRPPGWRRHLPPALFLVGLTLLIVALARPQTVVSLPRMEGTVILAFDVSGSMAADDMTPTRMEAAKAAARDFVERQPPSLQIGVVAFSDSGFAVQTPTNDQEAILAAIARASIDSPESSLTPTAILSRTLISETGAPRRMSAPNALAAERSARAIASGPPTAWRF